MTDGWIIQQKGYNAERRQGMEPIYALGNGYICARGYFEEEPEGLLAYGGTYMTGVYGEARYTPWKGKGRELVNTSNLFATSIKVDGESVKVSEDQVEDFEVTFEMRAPKLTRSYVWQSKKGTKVLVQFERFISSDNLHLAGQRVTLTPISGDVPVVVGMKINPDVKNLNEVSSEPLPVQPGVRHLQVVQCDEDTVVTAIRGYKTIDIAQGQQVWLEGDSPENLVQETGDCTSTYTFVAQQDRPYTFTKLVYTYTTCDEEEEPLEAVKRCLKEDMTFEQAFKSHADVWKKKWYSADITIKGKDDDQVAIRYNMLQLMQSCPEHTHKHSIGARGITGEMYEGCIFWDTELFMVPFFTFTNPDAAKQLLRFRHHILEESKAHAKNNYFKGAMYGWQVSEEGIEQTPQGVGAYYSIHVVADIAYAILEYWYATHDLEFMSAYGSEILIETSRFWESRVYKNSKTNQYEILAVRGPNEYGVIVHNNLYTNMMAQQNLLLAMDMIEQMKKQCPEKWEALKAKVGFDESEMQTWRAIIDGIVLPYDADLDLYEEDDRYFSRVPLDLKVYKTSLKRVIDSTLPYEALSLYQITKQADVIHLMKNLHWRFTEEQKQKAWAYYVPKTCFDSSLAYCMHAILAAQMGLQEEAYTFYDKCSNFDMKDMQLNTISGLHFANFGGTWQAVVFGFAGVKVDEEGITVSPHLPKEWEELQFKMWYRGQLLALTVTNHHVQLAVIEGTGEMISVHIAGENYRLGLEERVLNAKI